MKLVPALGVLGIAAALVAAAIVPTALYLYVEPRGRRMWVREGDSRPRKAPLSVRGSAWLSFLLGELAVAWLLVPVACGVLVYLQAKLGMWKPIGIGVTAACGVLGVLETLLALRFIPLGVRLLMRDMRDARGCARARSRARFTAGASAAVVVGAWALSAVTHLPALVHPWLAAALAWAAIKPVMIFGAACVVHSLLLWQCAEADAGAVKGPSR